MTGGWLKWEGAVPKAQWQGIRYVELSLVNGGVDGAKVTVHLFETPPVPIDAEHIEVTGGSRETHLEFSVTGPLAPGPSVELTFPKVGDHAPYTVALVGAHAPPVDPFFAQETFFFRIDCDLGDCRDDAEPAPPARSRRPAVDLLTKDYAGFVKLLTDWVKVSNRHWSDLSPASLERVLVELLAHHGDMLSYFQDRVANEAFVDTASQRHSLRRHGELLGRGLDDGAAAEASVAFEVSDDGYLDETFEVEIPRRPSEARVVHHLAERTRVRTDHNVIALAAWPGAVAARVSEGAQAVLLYGHVQGLEVGQPLAFVDAGGAEVVRVLERAHEERVGWVADPADPAHQNPTAVTSLTFEPPLRRAYAPWHPQRPLALRGNVGRTRHGERVQEVLTFELLGGRPRVMLGGRELPPQHFAVVRDLATDRHQLRALRVPRGPVLHAAGAPRIAVRVDQAPWTREPHLLSSRSFDAHYIAHADTDGGLWIEIGDGRRGRAVVAEDGPAIELEYRIGDPVAGNCGAFTLTEVPRVPQGFAWISAVHVAAGRGGRSAESNDAARFAIPASLRQDTLQRAVSLSDYANAALELEGVERATARSLGGPFNAVLVLVDPKGTSELSAALRGRVLAHIDRLRMTGRELFVDAPEYVAMHVRLSLCVEPGALPHEVRDAVYAALRPGAADRPGFFHPNRLSFGQRVEQGELLATVQAVTGVRSAKVLTFKRQGLAGAPELEDPIVLDTHQVARLDADPSFPERGRLEVLVVGLDPDADEASYLWEAQA